MSVFVPLAMQPFVDFGQGCKTVEVRSAKSPVAAQVRKAKAGDEVRLRWGYGPHGALGIRQWTGTLGRVWYADSLGALDLEAQRLACIGVDPSRYFDPTSPVLAFEVLGACQIKEPTGCGATGEDHQRGICETGLCNIKDGA